ncbi:LysR family transcriptional regulator [Sulfidibacter corallicola]|uniref:LysR family transcriptional regulator n=1 Tax=Sulfidibacter corallicola TaxID=2818388 RepID=A0A8A4TSH0_SULCO|nr:LysR family transcriptional regulator [Sulfidibacter corallicola]QTD52337.1 LysR family transcriptional regulator [Sulfidibacter corallicola]
MDYNKLRTLAVVARSGGITAAARQLHLTQQAVSAQIHALESDLNMALLTRAHRRVYLTREGERLVSLANEHLDTIDAVVDRMRYGLGRVEGVIRLGIFAEYAAPLLMPRLAAFQKAYPGVRFQLTLEEDRDLERLLTDNELDVAFIVEFGNYQLFERRPFARVDYQLYATPAFLREHAPEDLAAVVAMPVVDFTLGCAGFTIWMKRNAPHLLPRVQAKLPRMMVSADNCLKAAALAGVGMAVLPWFMIAEEVARGELVRVVSDSQAITAVIDMTTKKKRSPSLVIDTFLAFMVPGEQGMDRRPPVPPGGVAGYDRPEGER